MKVVSRRAAAAALGLAALLAVGTAVGFASGERSSPGGQPLFVILLVGDGMGESQVSAARNYAVGAAGRLAMDSMPQRSAVTTYSVEESDPEEPDYVPDSAATATAWSTGVKTSNGRIGTRASTGRDMTNIMELAKRSGLRVGNVSTARLTDATPAAAMAHVDDRGCEGPRQTSQDCPQDATENGGPGSIAEQSVATGVDVLLGGGADRYEERVPDTSADQSVADGARARGYQVVRTADELEEARRLPVLGLFAEGDLPSELRGPDAEPGGVEARCEPNPKLTDAIPKLDELTSKAISLLGTTGEDRRSASGFFLQVEGALIDKKGHDADPCGEIGETVAFDRAVKVALDYARANGNTTVIVTSDHSQGSQLIPAGDDDAPGLTATVTTTDDRPMTVSYGTSPESEAQAHTGSTVPFLGFGTGTDDVAGLIEQTEVFDIITSALGLD